MALQASPPGELRGALPLGRLGYLWGTLCAEGGKAQSLSRRLTVAFSSDPHEEPQTIGLLMGTLSTIH